MIYTEKAYFYYFKQKRIDFTPIFFHYASSLSDHVRIRASHSCQFHVRGNIRRKFIKIQKKML